MIPPIATRIPLVRRPKAPALPLEQRIAHVTGLADESAGASHHDLVARASGVLNYAALIASDAALPDLAADLCWKQHRAFADAGRLTGEIAVMALMPLINLSRLLTREGDGEGAYDVLKQLYRTAHARSSTHIRGHDVDLSALTATESDHHDVCKALWVALLVDGARALARIGCWTQAAEAMTAHRGVGHRLLDGRQIMIMSLMERGLYQQARDAIEATAPTEEWENAIAALLQVACRPATAPASAQERDEALLGAGAVLTSPDPATALFQTRVGLAALELTHHHTGPHTAGLHDPIVDAARLDAYAARDTLTHPLVGAHLDEEQRSHLESIVAESGLGAGRLSPTHMETLTAASERAEAALRRLLA
ncbi:hypothetical protein [Streptomonospora litoralis]|uniref:Uncharacterized protein n=1 Tax=Streptomonospora litoralis TaxID=2498135 RepID=A0A4P6Q9N6_9ACTN|nr:hypothetical protein [Streptomonospora litoralis]QBI56129.1 hypothetical protein EKD16_21880 [Streptomonospora litoralis]